MSNSKAMPSAPPGWIKPTALVALIFGVMTIFAGGSVLFAPATTQDWAGHIVDFVVWFNFLAGFAYVAAAIGLWRGENWAPRLAALIALATALVAAGFCIVVLRGAAFEMRTVGALIFRVLFWTVIAIAAHRATRRI